MDAKLLAALAVLPVLLAAAAAWPRLRRRRLEEEVARLVALERARSAADPEVRALRLRVWRHLLGLPDPVPWGRYPWKGAGEGGVDAAGRNG